MLGLQRLELGLSENSSGGSSFSPTDIPNLLLWLDASDASTITDTSGSVDQWDDKSGNAHHVTASGTARPTTGTRTLGGNNVIDFNGTDQRMSRSDALGQSGNPALSVIVIGEQDSVPDTFNFSVVLADSTGSAARTMGHAFADGSFRYNNGNQVFTSATNSVPNMTLWERASGVQYQDGKLFRGNVEQTQSAAGNPGGVPALLDQLTLIGAGISSGSFLGHFDGKIAEVLVYGGVLSSSEKTSVWNYASSKWSLS